MISENILIQIDTFINNNDKLQITKKCIESVRKLGYPILVTSHIEIPTEISDMSDYSVSDNLNILLPKTGDVNIFNYFGDNIEMNFNITDIESHSPSVVTSWINGAIFSKEMGFDYFFKIEYDFVPDYESLEKIKNLIALSKGTNGFLLKSNDYIAPKYIFSKVDVVLDIFKDTNIKNSDDYFEFCKKVDVPPSKRRIAGFTTYYALSNSIHLNDFIIAPSQAECFLSSINYELENAFPGFLSPLLGSDGNTYLCSYGLTNKVIEYKLFEDDNIVMEGLANLNNGVYSFSYLNLNDTSKYKIDSYIDKIYFTKSDITNGKYGTINFKE